MRGASLVAEIGVTAVFASGHRSRQRRVVDSDRVTQTRSEETGRPWATPTGHRDAAFGQIDVLSFLRHLHVRAAALFDVFDVIATLADYHAGSTVGDQDFHLRTDEQTAGVSFPPGLRFGILRAYLAIDVFPPASNVNYIQSTLPLPKNFLFQGNVTNPTLIFAISDTIRLSKNIFQLLDKTPILCKSYQKFSPFVIGNLISVSSAHGRTGGQTSFHQCQQIIFAKSKDDLKIYVLEYCTLAHFSRLQQLISVEFFGYRLVKHYYFFLLVVIQAGLGVIHLLAGQGYSEQFRPVKIWANYVDFQTWL